MRAVMLVGRSQSWHLSCSSMAWLPLQCLKQIQKGVTNKMRRDAYLLKKIAVLVPLLCSLWVLCLSGCTGTFPSSETTTEDTSSAQQTADAISSVSQTERSSSGKSIQTRLIAEQILEGKTGEIHYSYYLPEDYDPNQKYPLVIAMPGYDRMWFGEDSSGSNLNWQGFLCWTQLPEDMIVVSAQLTDWGETSARQAIELTEYFLENFSVDKNRIYAAGYSAGGETMSQAVSMRPELYTAYIHVASQWDGEFTPIAENGVAVYIFMAQGDEYYGSGRARDAYNGLHDAYMDAGWTEEKIDDVLQVQIPNESWFAQRDITGNYHGGANVVFEETSILNWIVSHSK